MCRSDPQLLEALGCRCLGGVSHLLTHLLSHFQCWIILWSKGLIMNLLWRKSIWRWLSLDSEDLINSLGAESHMWRLQRQEMMRDPLEQKDKCVWHRLLHLNSCSGWRTSTAAHISALQLCSKATVHICMSESCVHWAVRRDKKANDASLGPLQPNTITDGKTNSSQQLLSSLL